MRHWLRLGFLMIGPVKVAEFRNDIADLKSTLRLHTWILSANTGGILILLGL